MIRLNNHKREEMDIILTTCLLKQPPVMFALPLLSSTNNMELYAVFLAGFLYLLASLYYSSFNFSGLFLGETLVGNSFVS